MKSTSCSPSTRAGRRNSRADCLGAGAQVAQRDDPACAAVLGGRRARGEFGSSSCVNDLRPLSEAYELRAEEHGTSAQH
jgi:hypothetical protein